MTQSQPAESSSRDSGARLTATHYVLIVSCWVLLGLFSATRLRIVLPGMTWDLALLYGLPDGLLWAVLTPLPVILARRFPLPAARSARNVAVHLVAGSLVAVAHSQLDALLNALREFLTTGESLLGHLSRKLLIHSFHINLLIYVLIAAVAMYLGRLHKLGDEERRADRLRSQLAEARLAALRAQIRPHFLFNALHTAGAVIERDAATGRRILRQLGDLLRASLSADEQNGISLRRELELTRAYLEIEQARFGDRLTVRIDAEDAVLDCNVPALLLQPLVDNAMRHGIARSTEPGTVEIRARRVGSRLELRVRDSGPGAAGATPGAGIGLAGVRERLRATYGDEFSFEIGSSPGFTVAVTAPYRRVEPDRNSSEVEGSRRRAS